MTLLLGQSAQEFNYSNVEAYRTGYLRNDLQVINTGPHQHASWPTRGTINPPVAPGQLLRPPQLRVCRQVPVLGHCPLRWLVGLPARPAVRLLPRRIGGLAHFGGGISQGQPRHQQPEAARGLRQGGQPLNAGRFAYLYCHQLGHYVSVRAQRHHSDGCGAHAPGQPRPALGKQQPDQPGHRLGLPRQPLRGHRRPLQPHLAQPDCAGAACRWCRAPTRR